MGVFEFSELMVKWHVNDRPRGTHLELKQNTIGEISFEQKTKGFIE